MDNGDRGERPDHADGRCAPDDGHVCDHGALHAAGCSLVDDLGVDGPSERFPWRDIRRPDCPRLVATAARTGVAFYTFGLILLPTLGFVRLATFHRVLQTGSRTLHTRGASRSSAARERSRVEAVDLMEPIVLRFPEDQARDIGVRAQPALGPLLELEGI